MGKNKNNEVLFDENVNYDELKQHKYADAKGYTFYTCPLCGHETIATFITEKNGQTMCIDCWNK